jgi:esterase/lipase superfamily enzyme
MRRPHPTIALVVLALLAAGCSRSLVLNPHVLQREGPAAFDATPEVFRTTDVPVFYVTDRAVARERPNGPLYGTQRSEAIEYGVATVSLRPEPENWEELVEESTAPGKRRGYGLGVSSVERKGAIDPIVPNMSVTSEGRLEYSEGALERLRLEALEMTDAMSPWLDAGATDVIVFVHGFNNRFDDAVMRTAELWHFTGRRAAPVCYTWPAGAGLSVIGYSRDRESSEFTILHLKILLYALAQEPRVERVHIVSHSRGTDVASSVVRELHLEMRRGRFGNPPVHEAYKIHTLILAAPDLDREVFNQRFVAENAVMAPWRTLLYFSERDSALGASSWLFGGSQRMGKLRLEDFQNTRSEGLKDLKAVEIIKCDVREGGSSHSYLFENPAVLSDLILVLRDDAYAGDPSRPLGWQPPGIWVLTDDYLKPGIEPEVAGGPDTN